MLRKNLLPCKIDLHCHDDYGLALANAMAGIRAGANCVHTTVNGMGERSGIPDLAKTILVIHNLEGAQKFNLQPLMELASYPEKVSGFFLAPNKPVTGQNAFSHKSGVHTNGILKDPRTYEPFDPSILRRDRKIVIDKYIGKSAVASRLDEYGIEVSAAELEVIVTRIKNMGDQRKQLFDADILEIAEQVTGKEIDVIPHDISAFVNVENVAALNNLIEEIRTFQGVKRTETRMVLKKYNGNGK